MHEPIEVRDALKLLSMARAQTEGYADDLGCCGGCVLARAAMRPMLELLRQRIGYGFGVREEIYQSDGVYPPLAALRDHYDAVRPGWRKPVMEKCVECGTESIAIDMGRCPPCQSNEASRR